MSKVMELTKMIEDGDVSGVAEKLRTDPSLVTATTPDGDTVLHVACWQKQIAIIGIILAYHPDLNAHGCYGRTPLHYAVHEGRAISVPIVAVLMAMGADPCLRDDNGFSVEDWAKIEMHEGLADVLALLRGPPGTGQSTQLRKNSSNEST
ncbi:ankyrin repeat domain-containing protein [Paraburkholderia terrae]|uniref:ankyrin repeat domain-containing protein n=1 Tax=Paraburkholderia terrae TaxID=311230 RepID=UPI00296B39CD|nr:ankyrin repeat domain-containing protein [Paraburkholderia terrae]MDW3660612.1 ankyrin repeat domain-containing protein [Paraburkholderia terrae]